MDPSYLALSKLRRRHYDESVGLISFFFLQTTQLLIDTY